MNKDALKSSCQKRLKLIQLKIDEIETQVENTPMGVDPDSFEVAQKRLSVYKEREIALEILIEKMTVKPKKPRKPKKTKTED